MPEATSYDPLPKGSIFHRACYDPKYDTVLYLGAFGAGKSLALVQQFADMAMAYKGSRYLIVRKRYTDLRDTTLVTFFESVDPRLYTYNKSEHEATFINGSKILFRGLDKMKKVGSLEVACVGIDEAYELTYDDFKMLKARARQKGIPADISGKVIMSSNPCDIGKNINSDAWMYVYFVAEPKTDPHKYRGRFFVQANSLENPHLPPDYVANLMRDYPASWVRRFIYGEWGTVPKGDPVFSNFQRDFRGGPWHVDKDLQVIKGVPVMRAWDFGWHHPATVWFQLDPDGRVLVHDVMMGTNEYIRQYAPRVMAHSTSDLFAGHIFYPEDFADHAGHQHKDSADKTSIEILEDEFKLRMSTKPAHVSAGLEMIQKQMNLVIKNAPGIVFHPRCEVLISGAEGGYCRIRPTNGENMVVTPYKDGFYEHPWDALRYGFDGLTRGGGLTPTKASDNMVIAEPSYSHNQSGASE